MGFGDFGERLRAIREGRMIRSGPEISLRELERRSGVSDTTISQIETRTPGKGKLPSYDDVRGLARGLEVSIAQIIGEDDTPLPLPNPETERLADLARGVLRLVREHDSDHRAGAAVLAAAMRRNEELMAMGLTDEFVEELADYMERARRGQ